MNRQEFENWWGGNPARNDIGRYIDPTANICWSAWQEAYKLGESDCIKAYDFASSRIAGQEKKENDHG